MLLDIGCILLLFFIGAMAAWMRWGELGGAVIGLLFHRFVQGGITIMRQLGSPTTKLIIGPAFLFVLLLMLDWVFLFARPVSPIFGMLAKRILIQGGP